MSTKAQLREVYRKKICAKEGVATWEEHLAKKEATTHRNKTAQTRHDYYQKVYMKTAKYKEALARRRESRKLGCVREKPIEHGLQFDYVNESALHAIMGDLVLD